MNDDMSITRKEKLDKYMEQCTNILPNDLAGWVNNLPLTLRVEWYRHNMQNFEADPYKRPQFPEGITMQHVAAMENEFNEIIAKKKASGMYNG